MALVNCPECNKEISDKAVSCPNCGYPMGMGGNENETLDEKNDIQGLIQLYPGERIKAIAHFRQITGLGLAECKNIIDNAYADQDFHYPIAFDDNSDKKREDIPGLRYGARSMRMDAMQRQTKQNNAPRCPMCGSESITANQQGFGIGKAVVGAAVFGPLGLMAGNINSKKVSITCLNCGHKWVAGRPG